MGCGHCKGGQECPLLDSARSTEGSGGSDQATRFALPSAVVFLLPLVTAIGGSFVGGRLWGQGASAASAAGQAAGLAAGLVLGIAAAKGLVALLGRRRPGPNGGA